MRDDATADIVAGVDHVTTVLTDRSARQVFSALGRLGLFVVWPYTRYEAFAAGAVRLGNVNLEVIGVTGAAGTGQRPAAPGAEAAAGGPEAGGADGPEAGGAGPEAVGAGPEAGGAGGTEAGGAGPEAGGAGHSEAVAPGWPRQFLALAPVSPGGLPGELSQRGIRHGEPVPFAPEPGREPLYTTVDLPDLGGGELAVQFTTYPDGPHTQTVPPRDLAGVQQADRVVLGTSELDAARKQWAALLSPAAAEPVTAWQPGYGPALELRAAGRDAVTELVVRVRSLPVARAAFTAAGLSVSDDLVTIGTLAARLVAG